jgi:hypothetical protein
MGLGKSVITLTAIQQLLASGSVHKVLVIGPLRVARDTWPAEIQKWDHLRGLTYSVAVGTESERRAALMLDANIHIINRENVQWLIENSHIPFEYDMIVIDELSSFKSHQSKRFKSLMKQRHRVRRIVGLTGTPSSNGLMDLFAEYKLLDMGKRLGRFITQYRQDFFVPDKCGYDRVYSWKPRPGAEQEIYRRIGDITVSMKSVDFLKMPEGVINRAKSYLKELEAGGAVLEVARSAPADQISLVDVGADEVRARLQTLDLDSMTPLEAMTVLYELKKKVES